ncbi:hypothetical protein [Burkholderia gladioli]|uniref:hypothetical protein n=1 Tax=Burkholderia gladioli TaxID=28095 RepID=UPI003D2059FA
MHRMTEQSTFERPEWPLHALPKVTIERLFGLMAATYGARFAAMWAGSPDPREQAAYLVRVQKVWASELAKLSPEQYKAGVANLTALPKAPDLPTFMAHCRQVRSEQASSAAPQLFYAPRASEETVNANMRTLRPAISRIMTRVPTAEWAFKLVLRGATESGGALPYGVLKCATDAITSPAGARAVEDADPAVRDQYAALRQKTIDDYRMRGQRLWSLQ